MTCRLRCFSSRLCQAAGEILSRHLTASPWLWPFVIQVEIMCFEHVGQTRDSLFSFTEHRCVPGPRPGLVQTLPHLILITSLGRKECTYVTEWRINSETPGDSHSVSSWWTAVPGCKAGVSKCSIWFSSSQRRCILWDRRSLLLLGILL